MSSSIELCEICEICVTNCANKSLSCDHSFCISCLETYLSTKITDGEVFDLNCPRCNISLTNEEIKSLTTKLLFNKYKNFLSIKELLKNPYSRLCPQPDCKGFDIASPSKKNLACRMCAFKYCYGCSNPWHNGKCKISIDSKFLSWAKSQRVKVCPRCRSYVFRNGGCSHMTCTKCDSNWCWICGDEFDGNHTKRSCLIGKKISDCHWSSILIFLFFPISYLYMLFFVVWYQTEINDMPFECCINYKFLNRLLAFIVSPFMGFFVLPLIISVLFLNYFIYETCFEDLQNCICTFFLLLLVPVLFFIVYPTSFVVYVVLGIVLSVFLPIFGLVLLILKIGKILKNSL